MQKVFHILQHIRVLAVALSTSVLGLPLHAQEKPSPIIANLFESTAVYAPPPWVKTANMMQEVETHQAQGAGPQNTEVIIMEYIPKGQSFDAWTELYAIHAERPLTGTSESYRNGMLSVYDDACVDVTWQQSNTVEVGSELFVVYCAGYRDQPSLGEVAVFHMKKSNETLVKNYYHKRVAAFDLAGLQEELPIDVAELIVALTSVSFLRIQ
jgi:hypothetical protein